MNILLLAFALPIATILLAVVLQKVLRCPLLVAATFFAVLLIITFAIFDATFLVFAIIYTILAYVTAVLTRLICSIISRFNLGCDKNCICGDSENSNNGNGRGRIGNNNVTTGTWSCTTRALPRNGTNNESNDPVIILTNNNDIVNNGRVVRNGCNCRCNRR